MARRRVLPAEAESEALLLKFNEICPGLRPKLKAAAAFRAFKNSRVWLKDFILDIKGGLFGKNIISDDEFVSANDDRGFDMVTRRQKLLDAVERRLKVSHNNDKFYAILELFYEEPSLHDVVERLMEAYEECLISPIHRYFPQSAKILPCLLFTIISQPLLILISSGIWLYLTPSFITTNNLKEIYNGSSNLLGPGYHDIPYVNINILRQQAGTCRSRYVCTNSTNPIPLDRILSVTAGNHILIVGGPGAGKTRLTHRITELWTEGSVLSNCNLYTFRLRWFQEEKVELRSVLSRYLDSPILDRIVLESGSNNGKGMCFLLDGLDEYEVGYTDERNFFYRLMHRQKLSKAIVIVTTRNITSSGFEKMRWARRYIIAEFSDKQLTEFFKLTGTNLTSLVSKHYNLWMMCRNPLHASLLVKAFSTRKLQLDQISTRTKLFENILIMILERDLEKSKEPRKYEHIKDIEQLMEFPIVRKICLLAFNGSLGIPRRHSFTDYEVPSELKWTNLSYFGIEPKQGASNMEVYSFTHPSLMDFFAALHLTRLSKNEQSRHITDYGDWYGYGDVWTFLCGLTNSFASHYIELYNRTWNILPHYHYLCIFEAQTHSNRGEVESAAHYFMESNQNTLGIGPLHVTPYILESLVFFMGSGARDLRHLTLSVITFADNSNGILSILTGLVNSNAMFPSLDVINFIDLHEEIKWNKMYKKYANQFFARTPKLAMVTFSYVSASLAKLALYLPHSVKQIHTRHVQFQQSAVLTPYLLLKSHPTMKYFKMDHCSITDRHLVMIGNLPSLSLLDFQLSYNDIGDEGAGEIAKNINSVLVNINLSFNNIGGKGLVALLDAAKALMFTLLIDLRGNAVRDSDVDAVIAICNYRKFTWNNYILLIVNLQENELTQAGHSRLKKEVVRSCLFVSPGDYINSNSIHLDPLRQIYFNYALETYYIFGNLSSEVARVESISENLRKKIWALQDKLKDRLRLIGR